MTEGPSGSAKGVNEECIVEGVRASSRCGGGGDDVLLLLDVSKGCSIHELSGDERAELLEGLQGSG